jgi:hypothetical protein
MLLVVRMERDRELITLLLPPPLVVELSTLAMKPPTVRGGGQIEAGAPDLTLVLLVLECEQLAVIRSPQLCSNCVKAHGAIHRNACTLPCDAFELVMAIRFVDALFTPIGRGNLSRAAPAPHVC